MALARTRQATAIHRAIGFLNTGERARCVHSLSQPPWLLAGCSNAWQVLYCCSSPLQQSYGSLLACRNVAAGHTWRCGERCTKTPSVVHRCSTRSTPRGEGGSRCGCDWRGEADTSVCRTLLRTLSVPNRASCGGMFVPTPAHHHPPLAPGCSELMELYRLHLQQSDMPTDFGTLLQLRCAWWLLIADTTLAMVTGWKCSLPRGHVPGLNAHGILHRPLLQGTAGPGL